MRKPVSLDLPIAESKPVVWVSSSREDIRELPRDVQRFGSQKGKIEDCRTGSQELAGTKGKFAMSTDDNVTEGSGNVFADIGLEDADGLLIKADLALSIADILKRNGLSQTAAAKVLGIDQPKVSRLVRGDLYGFSIEQLIRLLGVLGHRVDIRVTVAPAHKTTTRGKRTAKAAA
jgi:predicted XRE-type DNA-binding protein